MSPESTDTAEQTAPSRTETVRDLVLLLAAHFLHCGPLYDPTQVFVGRDLFLNYYPIHWVFAERIRHGELPLWNPYLNLGISFWADPVNAVLYPPHWLLALADNLFAGVSLLTAFHFLLAELLFYGFLRSLKAPPLAAVAAAIIYATGGYLTMEATAHQFLYAHALAPGLAWAVAEYLRGNRYGLLAASVFSSLILLAGEPQTFVIAAPLAIIAVGIGKKCWREFVKAGVVIGVVPFLLWMPVLLPMLSFAAETTRSQVHRLADAELWSVGPLRLFDLFVPFLSGECVSGFTCWTREGGGYSDSYYMGAAVVPVVSAGLFWGTRRRQIALWCLLAAGGFLLAAGEHLPFYGWLYHYLPGWNLFRFPERMLWPVTFGLSVAVGLALGDLPRVPQRYRILLFLAAAAVIVDIAAGNVHDLLMAHPDPNLGHLGPAVISRSCRWALVALGVSWALVSFAHKLPVQWFLGLMAAVLMIDVAGITRDTFRTAPLETIDLTPPAVAAEAAMLSGDSVPPLHYADPRNLTISLPLDMEHMFGRDVPASTFFRSVYTVQTLEGGMAARYRMGTVWGPSDISFSHNLYRYIHTFSMAKSAEFFGIRFMTSRTEFPHKEGWTPVETKQPNPYGYEAFTYDGESSAVVCPPSAVSVQSFSEMYKAVSEKPAIVHEQAMFEGAAGLPPDAAAPPDTTGSAPAGTCAVEAWSPESVKIRVKSDSPRWAVYRRSFSKGWTARVNGNETAIRAAYGVFPALHVEAGESVIELSYEPPHWKAGLLIAALTLAGLGVWSWRLRRNGGQPPGSFS